MSSHNCPMKSAAAWTVMMIFSPCLSLVSAQEEEEVGIEELIKKMDEMKAEYERRISDLELNLELWNSLGSTGEYEPDQTSMDPQLQEESALYNQSMGASPGLMGRLGQTTRFSRTFNPAIGVVIDAMATGSTSKDTLGELDKFWLRAAEVNLSAQVDPYGFAYATVEGSDEDIEIIEAAAVMNRLPENFSLKGGLFLSDFGKFGQRHDHELPFAEKPLVYYDYVGGSINSAGLEVHQWFGLTEEVPVRWSVGMLNEMEGHGHTLWFGEGHHHDHAHEGFGVNDKRQLDNFAYTGRLSGYGDLTENASLQLGGSIVWAPEKVDVHDDSGVEERIDMGRRSSAGKANPQAQKYCEYYDRLH